MIAAPAAALTCSWRTVPTPAPKHVFLSSIAAISPDDVWAAGHRGSAVRFEHWNGAGWRVVRSGTLLGRIDGLAATGGGDV